MVIDAIAFRSMLLGVLLAVPTALGAAEIGVTYGHRHLHASWSPPPPGFQEGAVTGIVTADVPIDTAFAQPGLVRVERPAGTGRSRVGGRFFLWRSHEGWRRGLAPREASSGE